MFLENSLTCLIQCFLCSPSIRIRDITKKCIHFRGILLLEIHPLHFGIAIHSVCQDIQADLLQFTFKLFLNRTQISYWKFAPRR